MNNRSLSNNTTARIQSGLDRLAAGADPAGIRNEIIERASRRLRLMVAAALKSRPGLARWEQDEDVLQEVLMRLDRALQDAKPTHAGQVFVLAAQHVRWAVIDLVRKHLGPEGIARRHQTGGIGDGLAYDSRTGRSESDDLAARLDHVRLHEAVERLAPELQEAWLLHTYLELTQEQAADVFGVSSKTIQRRVREARLALAADLDEPGSA